MVHVLTSTISILPQNSTFYRHFLQYCINNSLSLKKINVLNYNKEERGTV